MPNKQDISSLIKKYAGEIGIDMIGFAPALADNEGAKKLHEFIQDKRHGEMSYLEDYKKRTDPSALLPGGKSVIVIALNYYQKTPSTPKNHGKIARYAFGKDYHKVIKKLLKKLEEFIKTHQPAARTKICVDSSPLLEKNYAVRAGLGFIGKNTTLITPEFGSFVLLGEIITDLELRYDSPIEGTCGTCTRCLESCPAKALQAPYKMDARRCISYLTIENRGEISPDLQKAIGNCLFGCDTCQEVCPYNKSNAKQTKNPSFTEKIAGPSIPLDQINAIKTDLDYLDRFAGSPLMRAKRTGLQRNAKIIQSNLTNQ